MQQASCDGAHNLETGPFQYTISIHHDSTLQVQSRLDQPQISHCVLSPVGTDDEEQFSDDQVCPQVAVDGTVVCVPKRPLAAEGGKAGEQTHQSH